jgi:ABC-type polysaccharide transport system permease subunit
MVTMVAQAVAVRVAFHLQTKLLALTELLLSLELPTQVAVAVERLEHLTSRMVDKTVAMAVLVLSYCVIPLLLQSQSAQDSQEQLHHLQVDSR